LIICNFFYCAYTAVRRAVYKKQWIFRKVVRTFAISKIQFSQSRKFSPDFRRSDFRKFQFQIYRVPVFNLMISSLCCNNYITYYIMYIDGTITNSDITSVASDVTFTHGCFVIKLIYVIFFYGYVTTCYTWCKHFFKSYTLPHMCGIRLRTLYVICNKIITRYIIALCKVSNVSLFRDWSRIYIETYTIKPVPERLTSSTLDYYAATTLTVL
jgi:hypothetical protein